MTGRTLALSRLIAAPVGRVWRCMVDPDLLPRWFAPDGYACHTHEIDLRHGGHWLFDMTGPEGTVWASRHRYLRLDAPHRLEFLLDSGVADEAVSEGLMTLTPDSGATRIRYQLTFPSPQARASAVGFGAAELGQQTLANLAIMAQSA